MAVPLYYNIYIDANNNFGHIGQCRELLNIKEKGAASLKETAPYFSQAYYPKYDLNNWL